MFHVFTRTFRNRYADWRSLSLSLWFLSGGPAHISRSFDADEGSYEITPVTAPILEAIEITGLATILLVNGIAWIVRQAS